MKKSKLLSGTFGMVLLLLCLPPALWAVTAKEILEKAALNSLTENFRAVLNIKTFKGQKLISTHVVWLTGGIEKDTARFFLDFDEPEESRGLRFLLIVPKGQPLKAYMFLPATKKTLLLAAEDPSMDLGGTGLTVEDIRVFLPKGGETETLVGEETVDGRECYKIKIVAPEIEGDRFIWVSKKELLVLKTSNVNTKGKTDRVMKVVEFFKTAKGTEFPREEEISIPDRGIKIRVRQENAVFGVTIPDELLDPKTFGTYQWKP